MSCQMFPNANPLRPPWRYINLTLLLQMWFYWLSLWFIPQRPADQLLLQGPLQTKSSGREDGDSTRGSQECIVEKHCKGNRCPAVQGNDPIPGTWALKESSVFPWWLDCILSLNWFPPHLSLLSIEPKLQMQWLIKIQLATMESVTCFWKCANFEALKTKL